MFAIISVYKKSLDEVDRKREEHLAFIRSYVLSGKILFAGRKKSLDGAVILAHSSTKEEMEEIFRQDPYYKSGLAEYTVIEFSPAMSAKGLEDALEKLEQDTI